MGKASNAIARNLGVQEIAAVGGESHALVATPPATVVRNAFRSRDTVGPLTSWSSQLFLAPRVIQFRMFCRSVAPKGEPPRGILPPAEARPSSFFTR